EADMARWADQFTLLPGETLDGVLAGYEKIARRTDDLVASLPDLNLSHPLPNAPWFPPGEKRSARRVFLHIIAETAQHAGHADVIRESLDGAKSRGCQPPGTAGPASAPSAACDARNTRRPGDGIEGAVDGCLGDIGEAAVVVAGVGPQPGEGLGQVDVGAFGDHAFGLLDHHAAVQGAGQLLVQAVRLDTGPMLDDAEGGQVGEGPGDDEVGLDHRGLG